MKLTRLAALLATVAITIACGADDEGDFGMSPDESGAGGSFDAGMEDRGGMDAGTADTADDTAEPEEPELEAPARTPPSASDRFVYIVSPSQNAVAKVDSVTLAVTPIPVGREPRVVRARAGGDEAVVLNVASDSVSVIRSTPTSDEVRETDIVPGCNAMVLSPTGGHAIAWYDNAAASAGDRIGSLQEVALVDVGSAEAFAVSVGFRIREVVFSADGARAFVVTDAGVNVLVLDDIDDDIAIPTVTVADGERFGAATRELRVTNDGRFAVVREPGLEALRVVDLAAGLGATLDLPAAPTDVDVLADGETALVALRSLGALATVSLGAAVAGEEGAVDVLDSVDVPTGLVTLTASEDRALTYTTVGGDRRLGVLDLGTGGVSTVALRKDLRGVLVAPGDRAALALHAATPGAPDPGLNLDALVEASDAISVIDLRSRYAKLVLLPNEPEELVFTTDGRDLFISLADAARNLSEVRWIDLESFAARTIDLDGVPEAIGVVPSNGRIFVSEESAAGRLTFIDPDTGDVQHVTAFQLNAWIE